MIKAGDSIPNVTLKKLGENGLEDLETADLFAGRKVVLFGLPGAFTPTCSAKHLPGFVSHIDDVKAKGVDEVICMSVNDGFVMKAWGKDQGADGKVTMLADGAAEFSKAMGLDIDLTVAGMGPRCQRFAMIVDDGKVSWIAVDERGSFGDTAVENVMTHL